MIDIEQLRDAMRAIDEGSNGSFAAQTAARFFIERHAPYLARAYLNLHEYAVDVTRSLTGLTVGGSEFFLGKGNFDFHRADISRCEEHIRWRADCRERLGFSKGKKQAEAERDALREQNRKLREALAKAARRTRLHPDDTPADHKRNLRIAHKIANAALAEGEKL